MLEAMTHFAVEPFAAYFALGAVPRSVDRPRLAQAYILRTADARLIVLHLSSLEKFWTGLIEALDDRQLALDPRFGTRQARVDNYEALRSELMSRFAAKDLRHWAERLRRHDVPHAPINGVDEVVADPQAQHLGLIVPVETPHGGSRAVRPPVRFAGGCASSVKSAPLLDEHGAEIRAALAAGAGWPDRR